MTNKQAIEVLKIADENASCDDCLYYAQMEDCPLDDDCIIRKAISVAIQALSQEPCERFEWGIDGNVYKITKAKDGKEICQQVCKDAISREQLLKVVTGDSFKSDYPRMSKALVEIIKALPPVTPKCEKCAMKGSGSKYCDNCGQKSGKWIPASEPPKELGTYLIQIDGEPYMRQCRWTDVNPFWTDLKTKPHWNIFDLPQYSKVVAWMPLPEPYESQESEDKG